MDGGGTERISVPVSSDGIPGRYLRFYVKRVNGKRTAGGLDTRPGLCAKCFRGVCLVGVPDVTRGRFDFSGLSTNRNR